MYYVLLMSTLHVSVCMHVTVNILMLTLHVACVNMYTKFIVHTDVDLHAYACFADVDLACVSLYNCHWYILMSTLHVASAGKPINVYKLTCLLMHFLLMLALLASVQAVRVHLWNFYSLTYYVLLMLTLHVSDCMHVTANILMLMLHVACVSMYTKLIVHMNVDLHAHACFADVDLACVSLYNCSWYILMSTLHVACVSVYICILC
jgi:hypothetical protein